MEEDPVNAGEAPQEKPIFPTFLNRSTSPAAFH